ncbi:MAG: NAD-dependent epimerase/dehydratase family protein [Paludibacter sp.]|nr:NAD-dependent epimerase/dehydratase family protein [Paludibacter sp.]
MNLLFTGASGFLGINILELLRQHYLITTVGLTAIDNIQCNIAEEIPELSEKYDIVLHAAGKAHSVPKTEAESKVFFDVNLQGTKHLCAALENTGLPKSFIFISTVAVYGIETGENITEDYPLNGTCPYSLSKIQAEQFLKEWCGVNNITLTILRPSLIAGPNPPGNLGAMIKGISTGKYLSIGGGKARKSVLMVQDIANLIPLVADKGGVYNVCDSHHPSFRELEELICRQLNKSGVISVPFCVAKLLANVGDLLGKYAPINSDKLSKITKSLTFSNEKARSTLGWEPLNVLDNFRIK